MASKKKWKKRAHEQADLSNEIFVQNQELVRQLHRIDTMLSKAEFEGPTIEAYVAQVQRFLQDLANERGLVKKSSSADPTLMPTEGFISGRPSRPSISSESSPMEGEMLILDEQPSHSTAPWESTLRQRSGAVL